jgi:hypothetical protein
VAIKLSLVAKREGRAVFDGAVLLAPMVKIAESMRPPEIVTNSLLSLVPLCPTLPAVPTPDVMVKAFRRKEVRGPLARRPSPRGDDVTSRLEWCKLPRPA